MSDAKGLTRQQMCDRLAMEFEDGWETEEIEAFHDEHARRVALHDFKGADGLRDSEGRYISLGRRADDRIIEEGTP